MASLDIAERKWKLKWAVLEPQWAVRGETVDPFPVVRAKILNWKGSNKELGEFQKQLSVIIGLVDKGGHRHMQTMLQRDKF